MRRGGGAKTQPADGTAHGGADSQDGTGAQDGSSDPAATPEPGAHVPCTAPAGVSNDPRSPEDVIALINALPKTVSITCYLEALQRPLRLNATTSELSVQPGVDSTSPRLFLFSGNLISGVVAKGEGANFLELSLLLDVQTSIKGEIAFPVTADLPADAAYARTMRSDGSGTRCAGCHLDETVPPGATSGLARASRALKPFDRHDVPVGTLRETRLSCAKTDVGCLLLEAVFGGGDVEAETFPAAMPTLF